MCMSESVLIPDASALPESNKEELPACKINSPQCVSVAEEGSWKWENISCFNAQDFCLNYILSQDVNIV